MYKNNLSMKTIMINVSDKKASFIARLIKEMGLDPVVSDTDSIKKQFIKFVGSLPKVNISDNDIIAEIKAVRKAKKSK